MPCWEDGFGIPVSITVTLGDYWIVDIGYVLEANWDCMDIRSPSTISGAPRPGAARENREANRDGLAILNDPLTVTYSHSVRYSTWPARSGTSRSIRRTAFRTLSPETDVSFTITMPECSAIGGSLKSA